MSNCGAVRCEVHWLRTAYGTQCIQFSLGSDLTMQVDGELGPRGLSPLAADLVDLGAAVYQIERHLRGRQRTNRPVRFDLSIELRQPQAWTDAAKSSLVRILALLGNVVWNIEIQGPVELPVTDHTCGQAGGINRITLLSGGLDSACGAAVDMSDAPRMRLTSFYTRQKALQQDIAHQLGHQRPAQWRMSWHPATGRGHTFRYRSFLFLCLAVAVADSWGARQVLQYENGILATAVPPTPAWLMTHHAHPEVHEHMAQLAASLLGGEWKIENPFLSFTKRQCLEAARHSAGAEVMDKVAPRTETCWFHWSNRITGGRKTPGVPCGVCIPCIVRRTALQDTGYEWDLRKDKIRNNPNLGLAFRAYYGFLRDVASVGRSLGGFYKVLPAPGRELSVTGALTLHQLHELFNEFATEFTETFGL